MTQLRKGWCVLKPSGQADMSLKDCSHQKWPQTCKRTESNMLLAEIFGWPWAAISRPVDKKHYIKVSFVSLINQSKFYKMHILWIAFNFLSSFIIIGLSLTLPASHTPKWSTGRVEAEFLVLTIQQSLHQSIVWGKDWHRIMVIHIYSAEKLKSLNVPPKNALSIFGVGPQPLSLSLKVSSIPQLHLVVWPLGMRAAPPQIYSCAGLGQTSSFIPPTYQHYPSSTERFTITPMGHIY